MSHVSNLKSSSISKKQTVALTGLTLNLFVVGHMAGNLFIYGGPAAFNGYAKKLAGLRPGLYLIELGLAWIFLIHLHTTLLLVLENIKARGTPYAVTTDVGNRSIATKLMPYTGSVIFAFVLWHLLDFTFTDHHGPRSILADGQSYGLFGVVYNSFKDPIHSLLYILAMLAVGLHLSHGIQSFFQTYGFNHPAYTPLIKKFSETVAFVIAAIYISIPIAVMNGIIKI